jgi:hypothetical protein
MTAKQRDVSLYNLKLILKDTMGICFVRNINKLNDSFKGAFG